MPSKTNDDHDDRYSVELTEPSDPVVGKVWLDESASPVNVMGVGVPPGGDEDQVLAKASSDDYDLEWVDQSGGGGGADILEVQVFS